MPGEQQLQGRTGERARSGEERDFNLLPVFFLLRSPNHITQSQEKGDGVVGQYISKIINHKMFMKGGYF